MTIQVGIEVEGVTEYRAALHLLLARLDISTRRATEEASETLREAIRRNLHLSAHPPHTPTPSPPGSPPSYITGWLSDSVDIEGPYISGRYRWTTRVGPTAVYGRIQELSGHSGRPRVYLPPRPYVGPASLEVALSGEIRRAYRVHWGMVIAGG